MNANRPARKKRANGISRIGSDIKVSKANALFIEPAGPSPPMPFPIPSFRRIVNPSSFRIASQRQAKPYPLQPPPLPRPVASRPAHREQGSSRDSFIRSAGAGGAAFFAGLVGLRKDKKKR